jgi:WXG100 family type VII secretion target
MAVIKVDSAQLRNSATVILQQASTFGTLTNEIKSSMQTMKNNYLGSAADSFIARFNELNPSFSAYQKVLTDYGNFLNTSAAEFDRVETQITSDQDALRPTNLFS